MLEKAKTTFLPSRVPVVKLKMPNLCSCAGQRTLSEAEASPAAVPQASLTCWSVTCSCSLATSCGRHDLPRAQLSELSKHGWSWHPHVVGGWCHAVVRSEGELEYCKFC